MLKTLAIVFGLILVGLGILGFIPAVSPDGYLLGLFHVNVAHNIVHLLTGVIALLAGFNSENASKWFFRLFGIVYALVALHGFVYGDMPVLGILANNTADTWLHTAIAAVSLALGFGCCSGCRTCH